MTFKTRETSLNYRNSNPKMMWEGCKKNSTPDNRTWGWMVGANSDVRRAAWTKQNGLLVSAKKRPDDEDEWRENKKSHWDVVEWWYFSSSFRFFCSSRKRDEEAGNQVMRRCNERKPGNEDWNKQKPLVAVLMTSGKSYGGSASSSFSFSLRLHRHYWERLVPFDPLQWDMSSGVSIRCIFSDHHH